MIVRDDEFIAAMQAEVINARIKFPSSALSFAALIEEVGELAKALLKLRAGKGSTDNVIAEGVQAAVMVMRLITEGDASFYAVEYSEPDDTDIVRAVVPDDHIIPAITLADVLNAHADAASVKPTRFGLADQSGYEAEAAGGLGFGAHTDFKSSDQYDGQPPTALDNAKADFDTRGVRLIERAVGGEVVVVADENPYNADGTLKKHHKHDLTASKA